MVGAQTRRTLSGLSASNLDVLEQSVGLHELNRAGSGLEARVFALVKLAVLIALNAPPAAYQWHIASAVAQGVTAEELLGVLKAIAPQVGGPRVIAAAPEIMVALGLELGGPARSSVAGSPGRCDT